MIITTENFQEHFGRDYFESSFKIFHELMAKKVREILLVSSPYDAFIMEEDGRFAERIINEYWGLNLSHPPKLTWASSTKQAINFLSKKQFDLIITMPRFDDTTPHHLANKLREHTPDIPILLLAHDTISLHNYTNSNGNIINKSFVWTGNSDLLLAIIKSTEDQMNVAYDTERAKVRVIIFVEDSAKYLSSILPLLYREIVLQTQGVIEESLNEEERLLRMRARPKILLAESYEQAKKLYTQYKPYLLGIISDIRFPKGNKIIADAGFLLHDLIKKDSPDLPFLLLSSEESNRQRAKERSVSFFNKHSPTLHADIRGFFMDRLAFGEFIFRLPGGKEVAIASNLMEMEKILPSIPEESLKYHSSKNHFSTWLMARSEISLASIIRSIVISDFACVNDIKKIITYCLRERRKGRQRGIIADFTSKNFDPDTDFIKIGKGSLGGKARGLAFISTLLEKNNNLQGKFPKIDIRIPKTLVISTDCFDAFINKNNLAKEYCRKLSDSKIIKKFLAAPLPNKLTDNLKDYLHQVKYPLAVRSSSLMEDAHYQPFAGVYNTYMVPNSSSKFPERLKSLSNAVKMVYASTYLEAPRLLAKNTQYRLEEEKMAVIVQQAAGENYNNYFFPSISGVAQSYNFYPMSYMKPEEGIAHIALGFGKTVVEGGASLRFSPKYPQFLPHFSTVDNILKNSQRSFFALKMDKNFSTTRKFKPSLVKLDIDTMKSDIAKHPHLSDLFSSYNSTDHKIVDYFQPKNHVLLTFANILKYNAFPLPEILSELLTLGRKGMGGPVEIEFAVNFPSKHSSKSTDGDKQSTLKPEFRLLQIRPMAVQKSNMTIKITSKDVTDAICYSTAAMGNGIISGLTDIVYVKTDDFNPAKTVEIATEISKINKQLIKENRNYILIGPGRWGSADKWLGIPVRWSDISNTKTIIETTVESLNAEPSQGSHFFYNICSLGISYMTITQNTESFLNTNWLESLPIITETNYLKHVQLEKPLEIKIDGRQSKAVILTE